jgi:hypothetical protein
MTVSTGNPFSDLVPASAHPAQAFMAAHRPAAVPTSATGTGSGQTTGQAAPAASTNALSPLNQFANSAGMQFQLQQGENAIQQAAAAHGYLDSGAAAKALQTYGQQTALNNYFMPYMQLLGGQQAVGAQAGSSVAGVGSSFGNTAANINSNLGSQSAAINAGMGSAINSGAQNIGNLQLANGQNQANMFGQIGGALGQFAGAAFPGVHY